MKTRIENLKELHRIDYHTGQFEDCNYCQQNIEETEAQIYQRENAPLGGDWK